MHNCALLNLKDMFENGTVISGTKIDTPRSFATACNVATQIIAQVASSQYGGQSVNIYHLIPYVEVSRQKIRVEVEDELKELGYDEPDYWDKINKITEKRLMLEIARGVQTIQYQILTLMTTNG
jgi:ribonucleoside-triphosphate reductase